jgi:hypothetical protein
MIYKKPILLILFTLFFALYFISCKKNSSSCSGNCAEFNITGIVFNKINNAPIANDVIKITLKQRGNCITCSSSELASTNSDINGNFNIKLMLDTTLLNSNYILVTAATPDGFILAPALASSFSDAHKVDDASVFINSIDSLKPLRFAYYPPANLKINLHRYFAESFQSLEVDHGFDLYSSVDYLSSTLPFSKDTTLNVITSADIFTTISWEKTAIANIGNVDYEDSLICKKDMENVYDIYY